MNELYPFPIDFDHLRASQVEQWWQRAEGLHNTPVDRMSVDDLAVSLWYMRRVYEGWQHQEVESHELLVLKFQQGKRIFELEMAWLQMELKGANKCLANLTSSDPRRKARYWSDEWSER